MSQSVRPWRTRQLLQFADFEVDLRTRELRRNGISVRLQDQPFSVLALLLEHAGSVVTREELRQHLWPSDTFVDFDNSLNTAINKIREALRDSVEHPRFLETLPRRGYRFIAPVNGASSRSIFKNGQQILGPSPRWMGAMVAALAVVAAMVAFVMWSRTSRLQPRIVATRQITNDGLPKISGPVTDGARLYFGEYLSGRNILKQVSTVGGEAAIIETSVSDPVIEDYSPQRSQLLVQAGKHQWNPEGADFWFVPLPTGPTQRMEGIIGRAGRWMSTRDGNFYFGKGSDIYVADHDGDNPRKIATASGQVTEIEPSPDGSRLRFSVYNLGNYASSIWEVRSDGSGLRPLLPGWNNPPRECCGKWTPDGQYYFFQSVRDEVSNIWILPEQTSLFQRASSQPMQLTTGIVSYTNVISSKNGHQVFAVGGQRRSELVAYDKKSENFVPFLDGISAGDLDFSPDGQWVAYVSYPDDVLWRTRLDGRERLQLTFPPMRAALAHWSPDGQQIAFSANKPGRPWQVSLISRDGGTSRELIPADVVEVDPNWSPDGKTLAYGTYIPGRPEQSSVKLLDLRSHQSSQLPGSEGLCFPRWSPNGRYLVAVSLPSVTSLSLFDFEANKWRRLVSQVGSINAFSWSSDSSYLYFDNSLTDDSAYFRIRVSDSKLQRVASLKGMRRFITDFGVPYSGLGPGETPLFSRDISTQEIYALDLQLP